MSAQDNLSEGQFSPHGPGVYQRPLPGMEDLGDPKVPTGALFPRQPVSRNDWADSASDVDNYARNYRPETKKMRIRDITPAEPHLYEGYLYKESKSTGNPTTYRHRGKNVLQDGHHRVARALLRGEKTIEVDHYDPRRLGY